MKYLEVTYETGSFKLGATSLVTMDSHNALSQKFVASLARNSFIILTGSHLCSVSYYDRLTMRRGLKPIYAMS